MLVAGEAGIGKTAVVRAFCAEIADARVLWGACDALFTPRPLGPFLDLAAEANGELGAAVGGSGGPYEVVAALVAAAASRPTVVVLEDVHWADEATLDALRLLARKVERAPLLVVASYRDDELERTHPLRLVLGEFATTSRGRATAVGPLSRAAVAELAAEGAVDPRELHRADERQPVLRHRGARDRDRRLPQTVRDAVLARAGRLGRGGAVATRGSRDRSARAPTSGCSTRCVDDADVLDECLAAGILTASPTAVAFRHELARLAIEESIEPRRRLELHRARARGARRAPSARRPGPTRAPCRGGRRARRRP